jgi:hypothetical protein
VQICIWYVCIIMINTLSFRSALVIAQLSWSFLRRLCTSGILLFVGRCMVCRFVINSDSFRPELIFTDIWGSFLTSLLKLICGTFRPHWHTFVYHDCQAFIGSRSGWGVIEDELLHGADRACIIFAGTHGVYWRWEHSVDELTRWIIDHHVLTFLT